MEAGEENCSTNLKRQREPLSDSEDNIHSAPVNDGLKRRRLEAAGQENRSPKQTSSGRLAELETKPDTPIVPSVRSRVQLLTQRDGAPLAQRCLSDPGAHCSSVSVQDKEHLLGEGEFNQRKERFKSPLSQASPAFMQSPSSSCPRSRSHLVTGIQQMLQCSTTPSSKQASRIRQERDEELNQLRFQPISENAWLKRSSSDSSLTQQGRTPDGSSSPASWVPRSQRRVRWPPTQSWDVPSDAELNDGSFSDAPSGSEKPSGNITGQKGSSASEAPTASAQPVSSREEQDRDGHHSEDFREEKEHKVSVMNEDQQACSEQPESQTVLMLSFSEGQQSFLESTFQDESKGKERMEVSEISERDMSEVLTLDEDETVDNSSCAEEQVELSTEEDLKMWRYPQRSAYQDEESVGETGLSSHDETNTAELIEQMFDEVLEYAERAEEDRNPDEDIEDRDSGIGVCSGGKDKMDTDGEKREETEAKEEEDDPNRKLDSIGDELLTFPPSGILSPLSKSVEAVVTPLRLAAAQESNPPSLLLTPEETSTPPAESAPLYSVDAYRTQRLSKLPTIQSVTPAVQRRAPDTSKPQPSINAKEKITALNEEAGKLQNVINQTLQALSCCIDEEHGRGSLEEAEAEKLLLVSCEKRSALLAEVARLREERSSESEEAAKEDTEYVSLQPCRGTVSITSIQLPLKVEFVCSSHNRTGRASHYFFVLIRYGPCNIVATPLATAADARNGDTISFPTSVTLKDIRSSFEIDVEVYSLSHTSGTSCSMDRTATTTKSRVTPRKLLSTMKRSSNTVTSTTPTTLSARRSSNFSLVGSHKISLASLGHTKFPLDKMKFEGKIKRLLGDEFLEKVPFLSPLEGNIYLHLDSKSHSNVQHQGFLTMFELISGFGVWHRRFFILEGCNMCYWNHPNDRETKEAEGSVSLSRFPSQCVRPVKRDSCARPFTFELVSSIAQQQDQNQEALAKCWFSADTKQERLDWMEKLNQALLDFHTWNRTESESQQANTSIGGSLRESIL
ncbi:anillin, actin binding protein 2 isoform 1-T1 [Menidia menidia]